MNMISTLIDNATSDSDVLRSLDSNGDRFSISRDVDFLFRTPNKEKAELVAGFINDYSYGQALVQDELNVLVKINMPVNQPVAHCISGFFACVAELFSVEYDGWGCVAQSQT